MFGVAAGYLTVGLAGTVLSMYTGDLPYSEAYPPEYVVERSGAEFTVTVYPREGAGATVLGRWDEERHVLVEAYRGMRNCFGDVLFFSRPRRAVSFVFRSEREFLQRYDERFAWAVHFYQCAVGAGEKRPERYAGLLFLGHGMFTCRKLSRSLPMLMRGSTEGWLRKTLLDFVPRISVAPWLKLTSWHQRFARDISARQCQYYVRRSSPSASIFTRNLTEWYPLSRYPFLLRILVRLADTAAQRRRSC